VLASGEPGACALARVRVGVRVRVRALWPAQRKGMHASRHLERRRERERERERAESDKKTPRQALPGWTPNAPHRL
jgi:hypothetical protein